MRRAIQHREHAIMRAGASDGRTGGERRPGRRRDVGRRADCLALVVCGCAALFGGCDRAANSGSNSTQQPAPADPLSGAPADLPALLDWAVAELRPPPPAVALPAEPTLAMPKQGLFRLDENLWKARITCDWTGAGDELRPLAEVGPFRSDRPQRAFLAQRRPDPEAAGEAISVEVSGFQVQREQVGSVAIELRVPFGRHFDLVWSRAGRLRVPLPDNEQLWKLTLPTDGFAEWAGALEKLSIVTDGVREGVIELRSLRFLPRQGSFLRPVGVRRVALNREARSAVYLHAPATVRYDGVPIPRAAVFRAGLAHVAPEASAAAPASVPVDGAPDSGASDAALGSVVSLVIVEGDNETVVQRETVADDGRWRDVSASLERWAGKTVSLELRASTGAPGAVALVGDPLIYEPAVDPPIVIVYLIDTLAADHIDLYGYSRATMPRLRALANGGVWFAEMFANSSRTIESIPNLFFSLPTERHGVDGPSVHAPQALVSLAEALRAAGFATASFCTNVNAGPRQGLDQGFDSFFDRIGYYWTGEVVDRTVPIDDVINWMTMRRDRPMLVYIHTAEPHAPYTPPPEFAGRFSGGYTGRIDGTYDPQRGFQKAEEERDLAHVRGLYDDEIAYADAQLGRFWDALETGGLRQRATIFVTADHGEEFQQHGAWEHGNNLFGEVLRIPLVVAGDLVTARGRVDVPAQLMDLMPTILESQGVPQPYTLGGESLRPLLRSAFADGRPAEGGAAGTRVIVSSNHNFARAGVIEWSVIEDGRWKLLLNSRPLPTRSGTMSPHRFALFDLRADRGEQVNVIDEQAEVARRLIGRLVEWRRANPRYEVAGGDARELDAHQLRELQSLGYIGQ